MGSVWELEGGGGGSTMSFGVGMSQLVLRKASQAARPRTLSAAEAAILSFAKRCVSLDSAYCSALASNRGRLRSVLNSDDSVRVRFLPPTGRSLTPC